MGVVQGTGYGAYPRGGGGGVFTTDVGVWGVCVGEEAWGVGGMGRDMGCRDEGLGFGWADTCGVGQGGGGGEMDGGANWVGVSRGRTGVLNTSTTFRTIRLQMGNKNPLTYRKTTSDKGRHTWGIWALCVCTCIWEPDA